MGCFLTLKRQDERKLLKLFWQFPWYLKIITEWPSFFPSIAGAYVIKANLISEALQSCFVFTFYVFCVSPPAISYCLLAFYKFWFNITNFVDFQSQEAVQLTHFCISIQLVSKRNHKHCNIINCFRIFFLMIIRSKSNFVLAVLFLNIVCPVPTQPSSCLWFSTDISKKGCSHETTSPLGHFRVEQE